MQAVETVSSGGAASGATLSNTGTLNVSSGGIAVGTTVANTLFNSAVRTSNGGLTVFAGGTASGTTVNASASESVSSAAPMPAAP